MTRQKRRLLVDLWGPSPRVWLLLWRCYTLRTNLDLAQPVVWRQGDEALQYMSQTASKAGKTDGAIPIRQEMQGVLHPHRWGGPCIVAVEVLRQGQSNDCPSSTPAGHPQSACWKKGNTDIANRLTNEQTKPVGTYIKRLQPT